MTSIHRNVLNDKYTRNVYTEMYLMTSIHRNVLNDKYTQKCT